MEVEAPACVPNQRLVEGDLETSRRKVKFARTRCARRLVGLTDCGLTDADSRLENGSRGWSERAQDEPSVIRGLKNNISRASVWWLEVGQWK